MNMLSARAGMIAALSVSPLAFADEDGKKMRDQKPAVVAPAITGRAIPWHELGRGIDGPNFAMKNITLLSWLPLNELPLWDASRENTAADCWGYTSPSGREYAAITVRRGTVFVEVTDPVNPVVVGFVQGAESLWHDVAIVGHYAYVCSEHGRGIQVIDLARIDEGIVRWVQDVRRSGHSSTHTLLPSENPRYIYACGANISSGGIVAFDLADPENPVIAGAWTGHYVHEAQFVTYDSGPYAGREIAFACGGPNGGWSQTRLSIVDVTDKSNMFLIADCYWPGAGYSHQGWLSQDRRFFYLNDELDEVNGTVATMTTRVIDVSDLSNPHQITTFTNGSTAIDHNEYVHGNLLYQSNYRSGLRVWDLRQDPLAPREIAWLDTYPNDDDPSFNGNWGNYPYFDSGTIVMSDMEHGLILVRVECYADCDTANGRGILDIFDFLCFGNKFAQNDPYACDCDTTTGPGVCDVFDFLCFGNEFEAGCP